MSLKRVVKALVDLGLSSRDTEVYVYLAKKGPKSARNIGTTLNLSKRQLSESLRFLYGKGIIHRSFSRSTEYSAVSFEKAVDILLQSKLNEANVLEKERKRLLSRWKALDSGL